MKKTRLALDDLQVESFATGDAPAAQGTVAAHENYTPFTTVPFTLHEDCTHFAPCYTGGPCPDQVPVSWEGC